MKRIYCGYGFGQWMGVLAVACFAGSTALAAQPASVGVPETRVLEAPRSDARSIETLVRGDPVTASNQPTDGYYKIRTASGQVGYVPESELSMSGPPPIEPLQQAEEPVQTAPPRAEAPAKETIDPPRKRYSGSSSDSSSKTFLPRPALRVFVGKSYFKLADIQDRLLSDELKDGSHIGAEYRQPLSGAWSLLFRAESVSGKWSIIAPINDGDYEVTASMIPLQAGIAYQFTSFESFELGIALLGGMGYQASAKVASLTDSTEEVEYGGNPVGASFKFDGAWSFTDAIGLYFEGGYRFFDVPTANPTASGTKTTSPYITDGFYEQLKVQFTGAFASLGLQIRF